VNKKGKINTVNLFILILPINLLTNILFVQSNIGKAMVHVASFILVAILFFILIPPSFI
jgi:hypothetical protein